MARPGKSVVRPGKAHRLKNVALAVKNAKIATKPASVSPDYSRSIKRVREEDLSDDDSD